MTSTYASAADVLARWIGEDKPEPEQVGVFIDDVVAMIGTEFPDLDARIDSGETGEVTSAQVKMVVCQVVIRKFLNPRGLRTEATGPFSSTWGGDVTGQLALTDEERRILSGRTATGGSGAWSIDTTPVADGGWIGAWPWTQTGNPADPGWPVDGSVITADGYVTAP